MNKVKAVLIPIIALILVSVVLLSAFSIRNYRLNKILEYDYIGTLENVSVRDIEIDEEEQAERAKDMKRKGQKSKFDFFCNSEIKFEYSTAYGALVFANVVSNDCIIVASIFDENENLIYRSGGIEPGKYISQIRLFAPPEDGKHTCRLYVSAYDKETNEVIGVQYTDLTISIGVSAGE